MSDVMRGSQAPALLIAMVATATFAGCGSTHKSESEKVVHSQHLNPGVLDCIDS
jgi:hypothetical protein